MRTEKFNSVLLSTLIIVSFTAPTLLVVSVLTAGQVSAASSYENIVRAKAAAYNIEQTGDPFWQDYPAGSRPTIIAVKDSIGSGRAAAAGIANTIRNGYWNASIPPFINTDNHLDTLLDIIFQWMVLGATDVLWYEGHNVYADTTTCSELVDALTAKGYTITGVSTEPIDASVLSGYDILVIPQVQEGAAGTGGDPSLLLDSEVAAIKSFVEGGKGLLVADGSDFFVYQWYKMQNKILRALDFGIYFQSDQVIDKTNNFGEDWQIIVDVESGTIGDNYQTQTTKTYIGLASTDSLAEIPDYAVSVEITPSYLEGLPGGTLKPYTVKVTNLGLNEDNYTLTVGDNSGWTLTLSENSLQNVPGFFESREVELRVTIPGDVAPGTLDNVTVTATGTTVASGDDWGHAIAGRKIRPTMDDTQVVEGEPDRASGATTFMYVGTDVIGSYKDERAFLKFDLQGIASVDNLTGGNKARLFIYEFRINGTPGKGIKLWSVENDEWYEETTSWDEQPALENDLGTFTVDNAEIWCSWDVTSFVLQEFQSDQIASFGIKSVAEDQDYPDNFSYGLDTKEFSGGWAHPRIAIGRDVWMTIDPDYQEGLPGGTVKYTVNVWNMGSVADTYDLGVSDNASWSPTISPSTLSLSAGQKGTATVSVTIPTDAETCVENDNITVTATSQGDPTVEDDQWVIAHPADVVKPAGPDTTTKGGGYFPPTIWGTEDTIDVGHYSGGPERGWLRFDLGAIPRIDNIIRARLNLTTSTYEGEGAIVQAYSVADDTWARNITWNTMPSIDDYLDTRAVTEAEVTYSWDVTSFVQQEFTTDNLASFALVDLGENLETSNNAARFVSWDDFDARDEWPYLEVFSAAQLPTLEVRTSVSPVFQGGIPGATLDYTVTVKNTGTSGDTYNLAVSDDWTAGISPAALTIAAGAENTATLSVTVPSGTVCTLDKMTVTATSTTVGSVKDSAVAFAHLSKSVFSLENLYTIGIDINLRLREDADNLVAKFKTYGGSNQGENVIYSGSMPWHLIDPTRNVPNPQGASIPQATPVEKVEFVLVDGVGAELATVETFIVNRNNLMGRLVDIYLEWPFATPDRRNHLFAEISDIYLQWAFAPTG